MYNLNSFHSLYFLFLFYQGNLKTHKLRHSGTLPARKYGQRRQNLNRVQRATGGQPQSQQQLNHNPQGTSQHQQLAPLHLSTAGLLGPGALGQGNSGQFGLTSGHSSSGRGHLKSTDEESESSSVEHSMDGALLHPSGSHSNLLSPGNADDPINHVSHHLKHQLAAVTGRSDASIHAVSSAGAGSLHHSINDSNHVINRSNQPGAPLTAFQFNHRFYSPSASTISAPQAHLATAGLSWLTSVAASSASAKGRMTSHHHPHDSFGLNAAYAAGLSQHPSQHLTRLTLLPTSTSTSSHHGLDHHLTGSSLGLENKRSSSDHHSSTAAQSDYHSSATSANPQVSTSSGQPNPDFSQLLD